MRKILGIDPGISGGLAVIDESLNFIDAIKMPVIKVDGKSKVDAKSVAEFISKYNPSLAVVEQVGARPGQGVVSMFSFGDAFGVVRGVAEILSGEVIYSRPQEWRGFQSLSGLSKGQIAEVAFNIFGFDGIYGRQNRKGERSIHDGISDALMIAKFGVRFLE